MLDDAPRPASNHHRFAADPIAIPQSTSLPPRATLIAKQAIHLHHQRAVLKSAHRKLAHNRLTPGPGLNRISPNDRLISKRRRITFRAAHAKRT